MPNNGMSYLFCLRTGPLIKIVAVSQNSSDIISNII